MRNAPLFAVAAVALAGLACGIIALVGQAPGRDDRAAIEDLQSRYVFARDWQEPERYGDTFTTDGVLIWAGGTVNGRAASVEVVAAGRRKKFTQIASGLCMC